MFFKRFYDTDLAQASYMVGCQKTGECLVIDAVRDISPYLAEAEAQKLHITHVTETHIHADYLSGSRELAAHTGAKLLLSDEGSADWKYADWGHEHTQKLHHGDTFKVGNLKVEAKHTAGHTPEHLSFLVTDLPRGDQPVMYFTGDFVFVGDLGRPDLLDEAAGGIDTRFEGARQMFRSLREQFLTLPDWVQVWPAHGSGSACGKALGAVPSTTVGYERALSWWTPYVERGDEQGFMDELLSGQPDAPLYYGRMKVQNKAGPALLGEVATSPLLYAVPELTPAEVTQKLRGGARLLDTRPKDQHHVVAPVGSVNIPAGNTFETWSGWLLKPEQELILLAPAPEAEALRRRLWMVGLDNVSGFIGSADHLPAAPAQPFAAAELPQHAGALILDVRNKTEYAAGHIAGAKQLHAGRLAWKLDELPKDQEIVVHCQGGARSAAAASLLRAEGFKVSELAGGYEAWKQEQNVVGRS